MFKKYILLSVLLEALFLSSCERSSGTISYFPFKENMAWHYDAKFKAGRVSNHHKMIVTNNSFETMDGAKVLSRQFHNGDTAYYDQSDEGVFRLALKSQDGNITKDPEHHFLLKYPLEIGNNWRIKSKAFFLERAVREINAGQASLSRDLTIMPLLMSYKVESIDETVKVSAGKFKHCIRIKGMGSTTGSGAEIGAVKIDVEQTDWYAPDTGLVKSVRKETSNIKWAKSSSFTLELDKLYIN